MRRTDSVFLLTLIDFLFQIIFFGVFLYAVYMATANEKAWEENIKRLQSYFGIGDFTELTDQLTTLAPIEAIRRALAVSNAVGKTDLRSLTEAVEYIESKGGRTRIDEAIKKLEEGAGKPHCLLANGSRKIAVELAEVVATESRITFSRETTELTKLLSRMHVSYESIRDLPLSEFTKRFKRVLEIEPGCKYTLRFIEKTDFVFPRNAAEPIFYLRKVRQGG
jgi:hypothetical protein